MTKRPYLQRARADAATLTRTAILEATMSLAFEKATAKVSLGDVAGRTGVSVQTVLRHFGSRDGLLDEAVRHASALISAERRPPMEDVPTAIATLFDHYEARGDAVILMLAQEAFDARIAQITSSGRRMHREWVAEFVAGGRDSVSPEEDALIDQLVVVTDVYAWKLLRRDRGLARDVAQDRVLAMVEALLRMARSESGEAS